MGRPIHGTKRKKIISFKDGTNIKPFNIASVLTIAPKVGDGDLKNDMESIQAYVTENENTIYPMEILKIYASRTRSKQCLNAIQNKISCLFEKGAFKYVNKEKFPIITNILSGRFVLSIKQPVNEA